MSGGDVREKERLKVLFMTAWYPNKRNLVEGTFVREHVKAASLRDNVAVVHLAGSAATGPKGLHQIEPIADADLSKEGPIFRVTYRQPRVPRTAYLLYLWSAVAAYRQVVHSGFRPDIIHAETYSAGAAAILIGTIFRRPVVVSEHSTAFPDRRLNRLELLKARITFRRARAVMPVSLFLQRAIEALGLHGSYRLVPNAVDIDMFHPGAIRPSDSGPRRLLFVGLLGPRKGFPVLADALSRLPDRFDWTLNVIGDGPNRVEYEGLARGVGTGDQITFRGIKSKREVADFMRESDALIVASRTETQGCAILEAMATGLPVVAPAVGGIPEILGGTSGVLVKPGDPIDLAHGVTKVLDGDAEMRPIETVKSTRNRFSLDAVGAVLAGIYREYARLPPAGWVSRN